MPVSRIAYADLPEPVRYAIEEITGPPDVLEPASGGLNSAVAATLSSVKGAYFVKALPTDHRWVWTQVREAEVAPHVQAVAPPLVGRVVEAGWDANVFRAVEGHQADYTPGSPDLPLVADLLAQLGKIPCPEITLRRAEQRLSAFADAGDLHYFAGDALLHTDLNNANVIVGKDRARIVDWGWATRGAAWLDAAYWIIWLIAAGHAPGAAERWAARIPAWRAAPPAGVQAFAKVNAQLWAEIGGEHPDVWTCRLVVASEAWRRKQTAQAGSAGRA
ncbi:aminoglycoside phosphotransferase [Actinoplanes sp. TBRC 11911]|uniref:aminoglycoside phosphotransferase n=1 Tax=Actinoplanes sp. TBRC 11911 TaxID=2729386 RepID=UPI00145C6835|nr:aminoglycoside phosphotransferase [Actinoplanes sp. TBRC 11911]NMO55596.1 aminoglycoside phosphotransferase [Actinoplanes sp. TBRC 11911]